MRGHWQEGSASFRLDRERPNACKLIDLIVKDSLHKSLPYFTQLQFEHFGLFKYVDELSRMLKNSISMQP